MPFVDGATEVRACLIGGTGFVGTSILADDPTTLAIARRGADGLDLERPERGPLLRARRRGATDVIIAAGMPRLQQCEEQHAKTHAVNVEGTCHVIEHAWSLDMRPVFLSSDYVFGGEGPHTDDAPLDPRTEYGRQKAEVERYLQQGASDYLIVRLSKLVSGEPGSPCLLARMAATWSKGQPVQAARDQVFNPTLVADAAKAIRLLRARQRRGSFNACAPRALSRLELTEGLARHLEVEADLVAEIGLDDLPGVSRPKDTSMVTTTAVGPPAMVWQPVERCFDALRLWFQRAS